MKEKKWQERWGRKKLFESNPSKRRKFFITSPYPYVNGAPHMGHSYTYFRADIFARFMRMRGFNVLYPFGFHATGEPILGVVERLRKGDASQIESMKQYGLTESQIKLLKKSPENVVRFWIKRWIKDMSSSGMSIDWRRTFVTALTPQYNRFIEWQYNTLKKKGFITQGTHPVVWCSHCKSPTGDHDRLEGEGEGQQEYIIIKFRCGDSFVCAGTLRPETVFGVTNMWADPYVAYVKAEVDGEKWIISRECAEKLMDQKHDVKILENVPGKSLVGKRCIVPIINKPVLILPSESCEPDVGTGIVMSVPSHAPSDWQALEEIKQRGAEKYRIGRDEIMAITPVPVIRVPEYSEHPAGDICEKMGIGYSDEKLEKAKKILYKKEFHEGVMLDSLGIYAGKSVEEAKGMAFGSMKESGDAALMWETTAKIVCRCTTRCHIKILENQWFLKYSDEEWKKLARKCLSRMKIYPDEAGQNFENTIDWLKDKACARKTGLGTLLPWDREWIVETLSDSTIYMAYYTIAHIIRNVPAEKLDASVFDYIFLGKGTAAATGIKPSIIEKMKMEFDYYYPIDMRCSAKDLIQNHLTFFIFHHAGIFPERLWPRAISVNGYVSVEGEKMSKSRGNFFPLSGLMKKHGADLTRINIACSSEGIDDADWRAENIRSYASKYEFLENVISRLHRMKGRKNGADGYLLSVMQKYIQSATKNYEEHRIRSASNHALFGPVNALRWYLKRTGGNKK